MVQELMDIASALKLAMDSGLIFFYRLPADPMAGFYLGTVVLAIIAVVIGDLTMGLAYLGNKKHYREQTREMVRMHNLSVKAIQMKDKQSYKASNLWANEYFGKTFFCGAALFSVSIWPVPFALGWMGSRFADVSVPLPFVEATTTYIAVFLVLYIMTRISFSRVKMKLPLFKQLHLAVKSGNEQEEQMIRWSDLAEDSTGRS